MTSRRACLLGSAALLLAPAPRVLAQGVRFIRVGMLYPGGELTSGANALKAALRDLGYEEGRNIRFEIRYAYGLYRDLPELAFLSARSKPDVIITQGTPAVLALRQVTTSIPIVTSSISDPVGFGVAASLARPGGNVTGFSNLTAELNAKRLALLKETAPAVRRVAYLMHPDNPAYPRIFGDMQAAAQPLGMQIQRFDMRPTQSLHLPPLGELDGTFAAMAKGGIDGLVIADDASYYPYMSLICNAALKQRLPSATDLAMVQAGAMIGYGASGRDATRQLAALVDRILKGANPGELAIERPTNFELVINLKTAAALGIRISQDTRLRADRVIE